MAVYIDGERQTFSSSALEDVLKAINDAVNEMYPTRGIDLDCRTKIRDVVYQMYHYKTTTYSIIDVFDRIMDVLAQEGCAEAVRVAAKVIGGIRILESVQKTNDHIWTHILCEDVNRKGDSVGERKRQALQSIDIDLAKRTVWSTEIVHAYEYGDLYFDGMAESMYGGVGDLYADLSSVVKTTKCFSAACRSIAKIAKDAESVQFGAWHIDLQQLEPAIKASIAYYSGCEKQVLWDDLRIGLDDLFGIRQPKAIKLTGSTEFIDAVLNYYTESMKKHTADSVKFIFPIQRSASKQSTQYKNNLSLVVKYVLKGVSVQFGSGDVYPQKYTGAVVSSRIVLNLGSAAIEAKKSIPDFWSCLERRLEICRDIIVKQIQLFQSMPEIACPEFLNSGIVQKQSAGVEVCMIGLAECCRHFIEKSPSDAEAIPFIRDIIKKLSSYCRSISRLVDVPITLTDGCDPMVNEDLTRKTRECCGDQFPAFAKDKLSCGIQLESKEAVDAFRKIETEGFFAGWIDDFMSTELVIPDLSQNIPAILSLIHYACSFDLRVQIKTAEAGEVQHLQRTVGN